MFATAAPLCVYRTSGSRVRFPAMTIRFRLGSLSSRLTGLVLLPAVVPLGEICLGGGRGSPSRSRRTARTRPRLLVTPRRPGTPVAGFPVSLLVLARLPDVIERQPLVADDEVAQDLLIQAEEALQLRQLAGFQLEAQDVVDALGEVPDRELEPAAPPLLLHGDLPARRGD